MIRNENEMITIKLPKRLDSVNAASFDEEVKEIAIPKDATQIYLDASEMDYISSAGLRVLLQIKKKNTADVVISEVSQPVYEILEITGFTELFKVEKALRVIDTDNLELLGRGMYGCVYRVNQEQILKVFYGLNSRERLDKIAGDTRTAFVHGIPTIIPFDVVKTSQGMVLVFELLKPEAFANRIHTNPEQIPDYADEMAKMAKMLAKTQFKEGILNEYKGKIHKELLESEILLTEDEIAYMEEFVRAVPDYPGGVHGDFHARNIMMLDGELLLIDMDDFGRGHPVWDVASVHRGYQFCAKLDAVTAKKLFDLDDSVKYEDFFFMVFQMTQAEAVKMWECFVDGYFEGWDEDKKEACLILAERYSEYLTIRFLVDQSKAKNYLDETHEIKRKLVNELIEKMKQTDVSMLPVLFKKWQEGIEASSK